MEILMAGAFWEQEEERLHQIEEPRNTSWGGRARAAF